MTDQSTATERAREVIAEKLDWLGAGTDMATDDSVRTLLAHPDLLADLAIEAGGLEQVPDLGLYGSPHREAGIPMDYYVKAGEGYHGPFPLYDGDEPVYRRTRKEERDGD